MKGIKNKRELEITDIQTEKNLNCFKMYHFFGKS